LSPERQLDIQDLIEAAAAVVGRERIEFDQN
jgi:hypothetical protein